MNAESLILFGINNTLISSLIAGFAFILSKKSVAPKVVHMIWLLVFLKLLIPPLLHFPVLGLKGSNNTDWVYQPSTEHCFTAHRSENNDAQKFQDKNPASNTLRQLPYNSFFTSPLIVLSVSVSFLLAIWSLYRIYTFSRLVSTCSKEAPEQILKLATLLAEQLKIGKSPTIRICSANISPMVWMQFLSPIIILPEKLIKTLSDQDLKSILAHELAHIKRRDYLVRYVEWLCFILFWWNPVVWWAQRHLRAIEEICCDELVLASNSMNPRDYAQALLSTMEFFANPVIRPPAMASEIFSDGLLERRFKMIIQKHTTGNFTFLARYAVIAAAFVLLPMSLIVGQDFKAVELRLSRAVEHGEINKDQAAAMLKTLHQFDQKKDQSAKKQIKDKQERLYAEMEEKIYLLVKNGEMSKQDAAQKLEGFRKELYGEKTKMDVMVARKNRYAALEMEIHQRIIDGEISKKEGQMKLESVRKELFGEEKTIKKIPAKKEYQQPKKRNAKLAAQEKEIMTLVKEGKMSKGAAKRKLENLQKDPQFKTK